jgi:AcrR family transcriptional regulator
MKGEAMPKVSEEHLEARRQQILDAATNCFARKGLHRATMQDVVVESDLSPGAIYRYFAGKEEIVAAIADRRHARERSLFDAADSFEDLPRMARALFGSLGDAANWDDRLVGIEVWAEAVRNPRLLEFVRRGNDEPRHRIAEHVAKAQDHGEIPRDLDPDAVARLAVSAFYGFVLQQAWARAAGQDDLDPNAYLAVIEWIVGRVSRGEEASGG